MYSFGNAQPAKLNGCLKMMIVVFIVAMQTFRALQLKRVWSRIHWITVLLNMGSISPWISGKQHLDD